MQEERYCSFVGLVPSPIRHSLTLGEIVATCAREEGLEGVTVAGVRGLDEHVDARGWDRPFVPPSPNMPTFDTALVYPGGCLLEGTNLSEGRGTTRPFEVFGAPWLDGDKLAREFAVLRLAGCVARPLAFQATFHKHAGQLCGGVHLHVTDARAFRPVASYLALVTLARAQDPERFRFRTERYEFRDDVPAFDLLTGDATAREAILGGARPAEVAALARVTARELDFYRRAKGAAQESGSAMDHLRIGDIRSM
jgi:uncharacterized protein YbbC (DUF1343 family)